MRAKKNRNAEARRVLGRELDYPTGIKIKAREINAHALDLPKATHLSASRTCPLSFHFVQNRKGTQGEPKSASKFIQKKALIIESELKQTTGLVTVAGRTLDLCSKSYSSISCP